MKEKDVASTPNAKKHYYSVEKRQGLKWKSFANWMHF